MINFEQAKAIVRGYLDKLDISTGEPSAIVDKATIVRPDGWVFFYNSKAYLETGDVRDMFAGNAPVIVSKDEGTLYETGTAYPIEHYIEKYEKQVRNRKYPRTGPDREEVESWIEISLEEIAKEQKNIDAGERDQAIYTSMYLDYMDLGRSRYLHGIWFQNISTRAVVKEVRAAFQKAAECIEMSFRMAYDPALPEYMGDQTDWTRVNEVYAISGFTAALMASDFALARRYVPWPRRRPNGKRMDDEVCNYVDALQACLLNDSNTAAQLCRRNIDQFNQKKSTKRDFRMNYHTLSMALLGIVEKNEVRFNGGLAAQLEFYEPEATHGEEQDTSEEFICDHAVALANLGLWSGMKLHTKHRLMPADLLISTHPALAK